MSALIIAGMVAGGAPRSSQATRAGADDPAVVEALRRGGLWAAAAIHGSYLQVLSSTIDNEPDKLTDLTTDSSLIVVGRILNHRFWLDQPGRTVLTDYEVAVERAFKGALPAGALVTVTIPGGRVSFPDGTWAETRIGNASPLVNGDRCLFFLAPSRFQLSPAQKQAAHPGTSSDQRREAANGRGGVNYSPVRFVFGYYPLRADGVWPVSALRNPLRSKYEGKPEAVLLSDVAAALSK